MRSPDPDPESTVVQRIVAILGQRERAARVSEVRIGLGYTAVMLADSRTGVAYTFRDEAGGGCTVFDGLRPISGRSALDLVALLESTDPIEAAVGLACANALMNRSSPRFVSGDILAQIDLERDDDVAMVGHFRPLVTGLRQRARSLTILERVTEPQGEIRPAEEAEELLPQCQVALITATSIINHTIDRLLHWARKCREIVVLGASTPLLPEAFQNANVTMLSGVVVNEPEKVLRIVSEGGGMRLFSPHVQKVCWRRDN